MGRIEAVEKHEDQGHTGDQETEGGKKGKGDPIEPAQTDEIVGG